MLTGRNIHADTLCAQAFGGSRLDAATLGRPTGLDHSSQCNIFTLDLDGATLVTVTGCLERTGLTDTVALEQDASTSLANAVGLNGATVHDVACQLIDRTRREYD